MKHQKHLSRGVLKIRCSKNMLCNFIEITLRHGCCPVKLLYIFRTPFPKNTSGRLLLKPTNNMSVIRPIRPKGESQNGCFKKTKHTKKRTFLTPWYAHEPNLCASRVKKCSFFRKFGMLCCLETPVLRFALLPYYRRMVTLIPVKYE